MKYIIIIIISIIIGYLIREWKEIEILDEKEFEKRWFNCE